MQAGPDIHVKLKKNIAFIKKNTTCNLNHPLHLIMISEPEKQKQKVFLIFLSKN
jgi:hypothetical protein